MNALSINGNTARHLSISFIKLVSNEWSKSCAKSNHALCVCGSIGNQELFQSNEKKKKRTIFLKHPNDNQMGNDISLLCRSHHAKHCLPYFAAAVRENGGGKRWKWQRGERTRTEWWKGKWDRSRKKKLEEEEKKKYKDARAEIKAGGRKQQEE